MIRGGAARHVWGHGPCCLCLAAVFYCQRALSLACRRCSSRSDARDMLARLRLPGLPVSSLTFNFFCTAQDDALLRRRLFRAVFCGTTAPQTLLGSFEALLLSHGMLVRPTAYGLLVAYAWCRLLGALRAVGVLDVGVPSTCALWHVHIYAPLTRLVSHRWSFFQADSVACGRLHRTPHSVVWSPAMSAPLCLSGRLQ